LNALEILVMVCMCLRPLPEVQEHSITVMTILTPTCHNLQTASMFLLQLITNTKQPHALKFPKLSADCNMVG